uniref:Aminopeptidase n=1 Tax=Panagrolaimus superbus TaxID=310955 RepID=A0A914XU65_9BILA
MSSSSAVVATTAADDKFSRLPEIAKPVSYDIHLKPCLKTFKCKGNETIVVDVTASTDYLKLHSSEIDINSIQVKLCDGSELKGVTFELDRKWMTLTIKLPQKIEPQTVNLLIDFDAEHNNKMRGFYQSVYKGSDGSEKYLVSTQFESTYARLSFPCWDEPVYKAKFDITLEVDEKLTALSNMNVVSEKSTENGTKVVKYGTTPLMSSYLVAFAVGEFEYIEAKTKNGCPVRVYTVHGKKELGTYALDLAVKAIDYYNEWFNIDYPLPKCDLIAIPDFSMGAMENWGLVTYREVALLVDPAKTSSRQRMYVALVVAHELAHFWFGDLATMKWWNGLWLKEGFASFMEYLFTAKHCPEFEIWVHFVNDEWASGMGLDCLRSSHPIEVTIDNPNELDEIYDSITYAKSNSVIRMLYHYLTEPVFQDGLRRYLKKFSYNNAETQDLWDCFSEASGQDIGKMMSTWTKQMGFPIVKVDQKIDGEKRILKLSQNRFLADGGKDESNPSWLVPITITSQSSPVEPIFRGIMNASEQEFTVENVKPGDWIKVNSGTAGFYRVQYDDEMLKALLPAVESLALPVLDRFGIANDLFALVKSGKATADQFLSLVAASSNENEYVVWGALDGGVGSLLNVFSRHEDASIKKKLEEFVIKVYSPVLKRVGWEPSANESMKTSMLRALVISRLTRVGHQATIDVAREKFRDHIDNKKELNPDLRGVIYGTIARKDGNEGIEKICKIFETVGFSEVERNCIAALGQASDEALLKHVYDYGIKQGKIRSQDLVTLFAGSRFHSVGQDYAWSFFKQNVPLLLEKFGSVNSSLFQHCFSCAVDSQSNLQFADEVEKFCKEQFDADALKVLHRPIAQATECVKLNSQLLKNNAQAVNNYLSNQ